MSALLGIPIGITSTPIALKICVIKNYQLIIAKKKKKHDKIALLAKSKLNIIEVLISKALINSNISQDEFVLVNNVLKEYDDMKNKVNKKYKMNETVNKFLLVKDKFIRKMHLIQPGFTYSAC